MVDIDGGIEETEMWHRTSERASRKAFLSQNLQRIPLPCGSLLERQTCTTEEADAKSLQQVNKYFEAPPQSLLDYLLSALSIA